MERKKKLGFILGILILCTGTLVDHVTVYADERIVFSFIDRTEIMEMV